MLCSNERPKVCQHVGPQVIWCVTTLSAAIDSEPDSQLQLRATSRTAVQKRKRNRSEKTGKQQRKNEKDAGNLHPSEDFAFGRCVGRFSAKD